MRLKRIMSGVAGVCVALTVSVTSGAPAGASAVRLDPPGTVSSEPPATLDTRDGCGYPQVCFYKTKADWDARRWTAAYKDITSGYQTLSSRAYGSYAAVNSRNDDGALLHFTNGAIWCLSPNSRLWDIDWVVDKIRIMDSPTC
ncbi:hypothetical protein ABGB17_21260 [Sphaerisporangium sp. B11E5]|uniref:hypothetical protein n=1 Tax=Sphaerisporangium sp. B11E5 TaxID=3153563 RepID=UPI00325CC81C